MYTALVSPASWRKVALTTLGWGAGALALMLALDAYHHRPVRVGKFELIVAAVMAAVELVRAVLHEKGWRATARIGMSVLSVAVIGVSQFVDFKTPDATLSVAERASLVAVGEGEGRRLRHPELGFSIRDPGPGFKVVASREDEPSAEYRAYRSATSSDLLTLGLIKGTGQSEASLRELLEAMKEVPVGGTSQHLDVTRIETSGGGTPEGRLHGWIHTALGETSYRLRAHGFSRDGESYMVLVAVLSPEPDALAEVLDSFER
jgi:hypothetical protein